MLRLPGLQDMIDNPQPICVRNPVTRNCSIMLKHFLSKKRQIRERHAFLASYDGIRFFFIGSHVSNIVEGLKGQIID